MVPVGVRKRLWLGVGLAGFAAVAAASAFGGSGGVVTTTSGSGEFGSHAIGSAASGRCSKAEATAVVKRLRLGYADFLPNPVVDVICGAFMGPRSQTMVASLASGGASAPFAGWAVFRLTGGTWRLVMEHKHGSRVSAAGPDIRETVSVMREGDSHCCPSGGTRARLWHWNRTRFTASAWKQVTPGRGDDEVFPETFFQTPSGNVVCKAYSGVNELEGGGQAFYAGILCVIKSGLKPQPRHSCDIEGGFILHQVGLGSTGRTQVPGCTDDTAGTRLLARSAQMLAYRKTWSGGGLRCTSAVTGLTCRNKSGHGFFLSRAQWRAF
jgi:uncharacterized protein DUF6636